jgi:hypothetical protein
MNHPSIQQLHDHVLICLHDTLSRFPPPHAPGTLPAAAPPCLLGEYLIDLGYLLPHEVAAALAASHQQSPHLPLGCTLLARERVEPPVLAATLLLQTLDRLEHIPALPPRFLGEHLLVDGYLTPEQLALVLQEQIVCYQHGHWERLGDLVLAHGWLDQATLAQEISHPGNSG